MIKYTKEEQKKHRQEWVAALRSGDYKQSYRRLRIGDRYCCLGVACEVSKLNSWEYSWGIFRYDSEDSVLPYAVREYYGLNHVSGAYGYENDSLLYMNDWGETFYEIADIIEAEPDGFLV